MVQVDRWMVYVIDCTSTQQIIKPVFLWFMRLKLYSKQTCYKDKEVKMWFYSLTMVTKWCVFIVVNQGHQFNLMNPKLCKHLETFRTCNIVELLQFGNITLLN